ncbi:hypothetical protein PSACC_02007 [Paramicrosporidium saccamoebae]|uniref:Uncharacterized protein n=1 Tax=Paramicrosporidium saccamoebae TaxID=1246581 RepID=A0A2H9TKB8_9FUNG|nr:hypothetical protein PSACC_02007 [Paramicrosporidium saccamoebae]
MEEWEGQLAQLWKCTNEAFFVSPALSQSYCRRMMRIVTDNELQLGNAFYWNACSHCGMLWFPGISVDTQLLPCKELRDFAKKNECIFMSQAMRLDDCPRRKDCINLDFIVYDCRACGIKSVFDGHPYKCKKMTRPVSVPNAPAAPVSQGDKRKLAQLQKMLQRSKPETKPTALDAFLNGLDPKLTKK